MKKEDLKEFIENGYMVTLDDIEWQETEIERLNSLVGNLQKEIETLKQENEILKEDLREIWGLLKWPRT